MYTPNQQKCIIMRVRLYFERAEVVTNRLLSLKGSVHESTSIASIARQGKCTARAPFRGTALLIGNEEVLCSKIGSVVIIENMSGMSAGDRVKIRQT